MTETAQPVVGIQNTKEVMAFGFSLARVIKQGKANDGKLNFMDLPLLVQVFPTMVPAFADLDKVLPEVKDLSEAEVVELAAYLGVEITGIGATEKFIDQVTKGLEAAKALFSFIKTF